MNLHLGSKSRAKRKGDLKITSVEFARISGFLGVPFVSGLRYTRYQ